MNAKQTTQLATILEALISIFILLTGIFVILLGMSWSNYIDIMPSDALKDWFSYTPWILNFLGIATILYGIKRFLTTILTIFE
jgi:hypothetical protein